MIGYRQSIGYVLGCACSVALAGRAVCFELEAVEHRHAIAETAGIEPDLGVPGTEGSVLLSTVALVIVVRLGGRGILVSMGKQGLLAEIAGSIVDDEVDNSGASGRGC